MGPMETKNGTNNVNEDNFVKIPTYNSLRRTWKHQLITVTIILVIITFVI